MAAVKKWLGGGGGGGLFVVWQMIRQPGSPGGGLERRESERSDTCQPQDVCGDDVAAGIGD